MSSRPLRCRVCPGPDEHAPMVVVLRNDQELPHCPQCGRATNLEGRCLIPPERPGVPNDIEVIRLMDDPDDAEEAPSPA